MADIPKESTASNVLPEISPLVTSGADKRSLESDDQTIGSSVEPAVKKLKVETDSQQPILNKLVKRKVAMLLAYSGVGYKGMQINPGEKTIEQDLMTALLECKAIPEEHKLFPGKMAFQRCARTDKGVSAAGQIVSLKMIILEDVVEKINQGLAPCIRVFGVKRTTASFNSKHNCDFRTYIYMLPTFAFESIDEFTTESYRITDDKTEEVNKLLTQYVGTHNFHNFTSGKAFKDSSAKRYIREFICDKPYMYGGLEFVILRVRGQSFMLHQIRKMIGLVIAIIRGLTPNIISRAFEEDKLDIPRAPGLGLVLESVHYEAYNKKWGSDGLHEALRWDECQDKLDAFKQEQIYPTIVNTEKKQRSMMQWLGTLTLHSYDVIEDTKPNLLRKTAREIYQRKKQTKEHHRSDEHCPLVKTSPGGSRVDGCPAPLYTTQWVSATTSQPDKDGSPEETSADKCRTENTSGIEAPEDKAGRCITDVEIPEGKTSENTSENKGEKKRNENTIQIEMPQSNVAGENTQTVAIPERNLTENA